VVAGCYLGLTLVNQLRIEWSLNEQYHYGWAQRHGIYDRERPIAQRLARAA
jgi:hypothetical protein